MHNNYVLQLSAQIDKSIYAKLLSVQDGAFLNIKKNMDTFVFIILQMVN